MPTGSIRAFARVRCNECEACLRQDCGVCNECTRKRKFGGDGSSKQACIHRRCTNLQERNTNNTSHNNNNNNNSNTNTNNNNTNSSSNSSSNNSNGNHQDTPGSASTPIANNLLTFHSSNLGTPATPTTAISNAAQHQQQQQMMMMIPASTSKYNNIMIDDDGATSSMVDGSNNNTAASLTSSARKRQRNRWGISYQYPRSLLSLASNTLREEKNLKRMEAFWQIQQEQEEKSQRMNLDDDDDDDDNQDDDDDDKDDEEEQNSDSDSHDNDDGDGDGDDNNNKNKNDGNEGHTSQEQYFGGHRIKPPVLGVCGICQKEQKISKPGIPPEAILLCDGEGCGKEFHLNCCIPPISEIPAGAFYCFDCSLKGSTQQLEDYFDFFEERKDEYEQCQVRRQQEKEDDDNSDTSNNNNNSNNASTLSEFAQKLLLEDLYDEFGYTENDNDDDDDNNDDDEDDNDDENNSDKETKKTKKKNTKPPLPGIPISELDHSDEMAFLGKPIRLYSNFGNHYHSGRIVDVRPCYEDDDDDYNDDEENNYNNNNENNKNKKRQKSSKNTDNNMNTRTTNNKTEKQRRKIDTYCLVRFAAGKDYRKTPFVTWLRLEEHSVIVGMTLLWAQFPFKKKKDKRKSTSGGGGGGGGGDDDDDNNNTGSSTPTKNSTSHILDGSKIWIPAMHWLRSARELVFVAREAVGNQVLYSEIIPKKDSNKTTKNNTTSSPKKKRGRKKQKKDNKKEDNNSTKNNNKNNNDDKKSESNQIIIKKQTEWGLVEDLTKLGTDNYFLLKLQKETRDTLPPNSSSSLSLSLSSSSSPLSSKQQQYYNNHPTRQESLKMITAIVQAEKAEQERVKQWHALKQTNPVHDMSMRGRDEYTLGPLEFKASLSSSFPQRIPIQPSPAISQGLDRMYILRKISKQQYQYKQQEQINNNNNNNNNNNHRHYMDDDNAIYSKDVASSLVCELCE